MSTVTSMAISADHPAIAGHFPGNPIVPGAVLLSCVIEQAAAMGMVSKGIKRCKFLRLVKPGQPFCIELDSATGKFSMVAEGSEAGDVIARGSLL